jgi:hypothetical protein
VNYVGPFKILHLEIPGVTFEIPPAQIVDNKWIRMSADDFLIPEVRDAVNEAHKTVWTDEVIAAYKKAHESEIVASYNERTLTDEQFAEILEAVPNFLPNEIYFKPKQIFIDKMKELYSGKHIIDCGAGTGHVGKILADEGFEVTCIDVVKYETAEYPVTLTNALGFKFDDSMVCLICRPDSEGWFKQTIQNALNDKCPVVYVRKKKIKEPRAKLVAEKVGEDNEYMFDIKPKAIKS